VKEGINPPTAGSARAPARVITEALLVAMAGVGLALAANALSPRGLSLTRNYFPGSPEPVGANAGTNGTPAVTGTESNAVNAALVARLKQDGLRLIDLNEAKQLFDDPRRERELIVFIDVRDDEHYEQGHIPGAIQFDRYHPEKFLGLVLTACLPAEQVVVYCTGGECEDSEFAAVTLKQANVPAEKIAVFGGGITEWMAKQLPVETGARGSGQIRKGGP
jgi:rhodanese-related sulfurtransferase